jgi:hypothetical protein
VLGGTSERDIWSTEVNEAEKRRIVETHIALFASMKTPLGHAPVAASPAGR